MPETSFVDSLVIADDERLRALRPERLVGVGAEERRRATGAGAGEVGMPEAIDDKLRAAVNAGSILSFVAGIDADDKADVLLATQLAQRAASARHDRFAATLAGLSGNFQIGAVQRAENGALSMALGAFYFHAKDVKTGVLFIKWSSEIVDFWTGAQKMTLNEPLYARHRSAVAAKLAKDSGDYIAGLAIV